MTANVMTQHGSSHLPAATQKQPQQQQQQQQKQSSSSETLWFARFLSRSSRKKSSPALAVSTTTTSSSSKPAPTTSVCPVLEEPTATTTATTTTTTDSPPAADSPPTANNPPLTKKPSENHLPLAPTKSASQTIKSKRSFRFLAHRKPSTASLSARISADVAADASSTTTTTTTKTAAYVPRHAGTDFSQVAIPTTYQNSKASRYSPGLAPPERPLTGTLPAAPDTPSSDENQSQQQSAPPPVPPLPPMPPMPSMPPQQRHNPRTVTRAQSTPDFRAAPASNTSSSSSSNSSSSRVYNKYREHQQQHAIHNSIYTVPEYDGGHGGRDSHSQSHSRPSSASVRGGPHPHLGRRPSNISMRPASQRSSSSNNNGRPGSLAEHASPPGMSSFGRKLAEYIKPTMHAGERPPLYPVH